MEVKAKMDVFSKKFEKQLQEALKTERDHHQALLTEIKALHKGLSDERDEAARDLAQLDENLTEQIRHSGEHLKGVLLGWNQQSQEYADK